MTHPLLMTPPYSMKIFTVKTFAICPETAKFAKVFTHKRFLLYGTIKKFKIGRESGAAWAAPVPTALLFSIVYLTLINLEMVMEEAVVEETGPVTKQPMKAPFFCL